MLEVMMVKVNYLRLLYSYMILYDSSQILGFDLECLVTTYGSMISYECMWLKVCALSPFVYMRYLIRCKCKLESIVETWS